LLLMAAPEQPWTPPVPPAPPLEGPAAPARAAGVPELLYINFDGAVLQDGCGNDSRYDCSTLSGLFAGYVGPFTGNESQRMNILQATRKTLADFGVQVVTRRPPDDVNYTMVIYGDLGPQSFAGIAPYIDCEDLRDNDTSFTQGFAGSNTGSTVILQEAAHTWGLEHVDGLFDVLNPFKAANNSQSFTDECLKIVGSTDVENDRTPGVCNQIHTLFCDAGYQNSYREMLHLFGTHVPDVEAPTLDIVYPADGDVFALPTTFSLLGDIDDNLHPQFYHVEIYNRDEMIFEKTDIGLDLVLSDPPEGDYDIRVVITDEEGNATEDTVQFTILPEGSEIPADEREDPLGSNDPVQKGCRVGGDDPRGPSPLWLLGLVGLLRRREACG
jgi:MYXO-CTERM domain-containing protein